MKITEGRERYTAWMKDRGLARQTIGQSYYSLRWFGEFLKGRGVEDLKDVTTALVEEFKARLMEREDMTTGLKLKTQTVEAYLSPIRLFFAGAVEWGWTSSNPAAGIMRGLPRRGTLRSSLTAGEMEEVLSRSDTETPIGLRDRLILELMYSTGIRMEEVVNLELSDVDLKKNLLHVKASKGGRERRVPLAGAARGFLERYLKEIRPAWNRPMKRGGVRRRESALFYSPRRGPMSEDVLEKMVGGHVRAVRADVPNAGQAIRHACAVRLLSGGATIQAVHEFLGQMRIRPTENYTRPTAT